MPLVSLIVPVYKAEKWLHRCVDSILAQTMEDFELLLIDDGSPDRSGEICDEYAAKDSRVRVFHKENGGVSSARQMGIDNANGEYIIHCDPDDWVEPNMLMELIRCAKETGSDMIVCDFVWEGRYKQNYLKQDCSLFSCADDFLRALFWNKIHGSLCNKLIRSDIIRANNIFIPEKLILCEDLFFCSMLLKNNITFAYCPKAFYHYCENDCSLTNKITRKSVNSKVVLIEFLSKEFLAHRYDDFFVLKKSILLDALKAKQFSLLKKLYPEIHNRIIFESRRYNFRFPNSGILKIALTKGPRFAYYLYFFTINFIRLGQYIKQFFSI